MRFIGKILAFLLLTQIFCVASAQEKYDSESFITVWASDSDNWWLEIPINPWSGPYKYNVEICDKQGRVIASSRNCNNIYRSPVLSADTVIVKINGQFPQICHYFENDGGVNRQQIISVVQWGNIKWKSFENAFFGCRNMTVNALDAPDLSNVTNLSNMFWGVWMFNADIGHWDVSNITDMSGMFGDNTFFNQDISMWNVSKVTDMSGMFERAIAFNQDISTWDVGNVVNMSYMFSGARSFNRDIGTWQISNVVNMAGMFIGVTLSTEFYNALLNGWSKKELKWRQVVFNAGRSKCSAEAEQAKKKLEETYGWKITDGHTQ